jgi:hypothetical protein
LQITLDTGLEKGFEDTSPPPCLPSTEYIGKGQVPGISDIQSITGIDNVRDTSSGNSFVIDPGEDTNKESSN